MSRLNAGAFSFVPGQTFRPPNQPGQQQQGQQPQPGQPGQPQQQQQQQPYGQHPYPQYAPQQQQGYGYYPQQQQQQYGGQYPQYSGPPNQYYQQGGYPPAQQHQYYPPQQDAPAPAPPQQAPPPKIENTGPAQTISLNIGGSKPAAATPPPAAAPAATKPAAKSAAAEKPAKADKEKADKPEKTEKDKPSTTVRAGNYNFSTEKSKTDADAILKEQLALADQETINELYGSKEDEEADSKIKAHLNVVFIGHVDAGKSTMGGNLLYITGMVDKRTMEKYEKEAKEAGRESWYLSWALDSTAQERAKGKTVEVGRAYFETEAKRYTILDAPGHSTFVPSMISGAAQADIAILVISARKGEFETGFEKGGQTREHITLVKTAGVTKLIIVINKMDDPTVEWSKARYDEIKDKMIPFVRGSGYNPKTDLTFLPVSGFTGANLKDRLAKGVADWFEGPSLLEHLDKMPIGDRKTRGPVIMPISEKYKDLGTVIVGKLESGRVRKTDSLLLMPNRTMVEVAAIYNEMEEEIPVAISGDNVRIRLRGVDDEDISPGFVLTSPGKPVHTVKQFEAQLAILEHKNIICAGYGAVMHVHTLAEEITLVSLLHYLDKKTGRRSKKPPQFAKKGQQIIALVETTALICVETYKDHPQLGRFTLRDEGKTIAMGKITKLRELKEDEVVAALAAVKLQA